MVRYRAEFFCNKKWWVVKDSRNREALFKSYADARNNAHEQGFFKIRIRKVEL